MFENTILNALIKYHIHIQTQNGLHNVKPDSSFIKNIKTCEEFIEQGNEVTTLWMKNNHTVVSRAVKYAHDSIHRDYLKSDAEYLSEEHKELNRCVNIFKDFYEKLGIDCKYMDINF